MVEDGAEVVVVTVVVVGEELGVCVVVDVGSTHVVLGSCTQYCSAANNRLVHSCWMAVK